MIFYLFLECCLLVWLRGEGNLCDINGVSLFSSVFFVRLFFVFVFFFVWRRLVFWRDLSSEREKYFSFFLSFFFCMVETQ